ncbi:MAG: CBS domain-containing protein [Burkholderiales bacterium]|jgi:CBS domain-containing protein|nr:CBS domain-containing protein [Burkholderiales bacterium]MBK9347379.1 CBS domain-containing protein [Burkholderiales bacterium]MBP8053691.1 CBS domain-containing protein [Burkholderiaceae bacterium]
MRPVLELLKKRDPTNWSLNPQQSVFDALQILSDHNVGALMVLDNGRLAGVFSERDYTRKIALAGKSSKETLVKDIMSTSVITVSPQVRTRDCMALMGKKGIRHLPVVDGEKVLGMVSIRELMNDIIADHEMTINQLQHYITG